MDRELTQQALGLLTEARKIIRASSSRNLAKDWDRRATETLASGREAIAKPEGKLSFGTSPDEQVAELPPVPTFTGRHVMDAGCCGYSAADMRAYALQAISAYRTAHGVAA